MYLKEISYISSNCNQTPTAVDWGHNNIVCYASCNSVLLYDPTLGKVTETLVAHTSRVNSVRWIRGNDTGKETELVSGSSDGSVILWSQKDNSNVYNPQILDGHKLNVNIVDGIYKYENKRNLYVLSISMDSTAKIWLRIDCSDEIVLLQTLNFGYHIGVSVRITILNNDELMIACGLDNSKIQLFVQSDSKFEASALLSGHEDWVRGIDFTKDGNDIILASSSQDTFIRLWRITPHKATTTPDPNDYNKLRIKTTTEAYDIFLESVLAGHEGWVYSVNWNKESMQLLSASIDKSMIIWEFDASSNLWLEKVRVGEVGGNTLGFYGGIFNPNGDRILAYSYHGAFHIWKAVEKASDWQPCVTVGGHFGEVTDIAWEPQHGEFLYSISADQTTRIHAPWTNKDNQMIWHEIARPQVHGYDLSCIAVLSRYKFASGAEEKVIRTFQAPETFIGNFKRLCNDIVEDSVAGDLTQGLPKGASVPSLGLSNKAVFNDDNLSETAPVDRRNPYPEESHFTAQILNEPPTEEVLIQNTLWPEIQKLYGHGYEIIALAASPDGKFLASACKSTKPEHAAVLIWDTSRWQQTQSLLSHTLTVVQMQFSPDSQKLLTVSRDRRWSVFAKNPIERFELVATTDRKTAYHSRIIWTGAWSHDSKYFVTGSRDGRVMIWSENPGKVIESSIGKYEAVTEGLELKNQSVTASSFAPNLVPNEKYLISLGLENGEIRVYKWSCGELLELVLQFDQRIAHHLMVTKLAFRPKFGKAGDKENSENDNILQLASCSSDSSVRIFDINVL